RERLGGLLALGPLLLPAGGARRLVADPLLLGLPRLALLLLAPALLLEELLAQLLGPAASVDRQRRGLAAGVGEGGRAQPAHLVNAQRVLRRARDRRGHSAEGVVGDLAMADDALEDERILAVETGDLELPLGRIRVLQEPRQLVRRQGLEGLPGLRRDLLLR